MNSLVQWPCDHITSITYQHYPKCPVCLLQEGKLVRTENIMNQSRESEEKNNSKEAIEFSKTFNRNGCPYCGGI